MSEPPFLALAPELKQGIFLQLPDVSSLLSIILTCSSLHSTFSDAEGLILTKILERNTHPSAAFDALAVFQASRLGLTTETWSKKAVKEIMSAYDGKRIPPWSRKWCLRDALRFERLDGMINYFTNEFISSTLAIKQVAMVALSQLTACRPASFAEIGRIKRTFYRYELYYNLFRMRKPVTSRGVRGQLLIVKPVNAFRQQERYDTFFVKFPAWENEQLACVREFLSTRLMIPFNDVAKHDIVWGQRKVNYLIDEDTRGCLNREEHLIRGLVYLHRVVTAPMYEARYNAFDTTLDLDPLSLYDDLSYQPKWSHYHVVFANWSKDERSRVLDDPHARDTDAGPKSAWLWAHEESYALYRNDELHGCENSLRQSGYVMWDLFRWIGWGLSDMAFDEWQDLCYDQQDHQDQSSTKDQSAEMRYSFKARSRIYHAGGRGWWAPGDESRIVWPGGKAPDGWVSEEEWWKGHLLAEAKRHEEMEKRAEKEARRRLRNWSSLEELLHATE